MWVILAFLSATLLGFYDVFKKQALKENAVIPVLLLNTLFSSIIFLPFILLSHNGNIDAGSIFFCSDYNLAEQKYIVVKSCIVLSSWLLAYFGLKHLPLTIVGPINATRPVMVLVGAMLFFAERLNIWQWLGVAVALIGIEMLKKTSKKEGINWFHNKWIYYVILARSRVRAIRQIPYGFAREWRCGTEQDGSAGLVQHLPVLYDGCHARPAVVAEAQKHHALSLALEHSVDKYIPFCC